MGGQEFQAMAGLGRPWPAMAGLGRPWPAMAGLGRPRPALEAGDGVRQEVPIIENSSLQSVGGHKKTCLSWSQTDERGKHGFH